MPALRVFHASVVGRRVRAHATPARNRCKRLGVARHHPQTKTRTKTKKQRYARATRYLCLVVLISAPACQFLPSASFLGHCVRAHRACGRRIEQIESRHRPLCLVHVPVPHQHLFGGGGGRRGAVVVLGVRRARAEGEKACVKKACRWDTWHRANHACALILVGMQACKYVARSQPPPKTPDTCSLSFSLCLTYPLSSRPSPPLSLSLSLCLSINIVWHLNGCDVDESLRSQCRTRLLHLCCGE